MIQFIVNPAIELIDPMAESYLLVNPILMTCENDSLLYGKTDILEHYEMDETIYLKTKAYITDLSDRVTDYYLSIIKNCYNLELDFTQGRYLLGMWLRDIFFDFYQKYKRIKNLDSKNVYMLAHPFCLPCVTSGMEDPANIGIFEYENITYSFLFRILGFQVHVVDKPLASQELNNRSFLKRLKRVIRDPQRIIRYAKRKLEPISSLECEFGGNVLVIQSRMGIEAEKEIAKKSDYKVDFLSADYFHSRHYACMNGMQADIEKRKASFCGFKSDKWESEFEALVDSLLTEFLPISFFEGITLLYNTATEITGEWKYKKVYHSAYASELVSLCYGLAHKSGSKIIDIQHAGAYNIMNGNGITEYEVWDEFLTWGWELEGLDFKNVRPIAMTRVSGRKTPFRNCGTISRILMVSCIPELYDRGIGWSTYSFEKEQMDFIEQLRPQLRKSLVLRTNDNKGILVNWCKRNYPEVVIENISDLSFNESVEKSDLVVCTYNSTTCIESITMGRPFVMFEGMKIISYNPWFVKHLNKMAEVGIYQKTGEKMAAKLNSTEDILRWLYGGAVTKVYEDYISDLGNSKDAAIDLWYREFVS